MTLLSRTKRAALFGAALICTGLAAVGADMVFSTGSQFLPGSGLVINDLNVMVDRVNDLSDGTQPIAGDLSVVGTITGTSSSASALTIGPNGATTPILKVDASTTSAAAGLSITGAASLSGVAIAAIGGAAEPLTIDAKGTGTIGIGSVSTGAVTITPATTITGALTPTGGVAAASGGSASPRNIASCGVPAQVSTAGTDATPSVTEQYAAEVFIPANMTVTGVALFNGSATGSGNVQVSMYTAAGAPVTAAQSASTAISGTDAYQLVPFAVAWAAKGPATYYINTQYDNTSTRFNTHTLAGACGAGKFTGTTYGTFATQTMPTTFTTGLGPIASLY